MGNISTNSTDQNQQNTILKVNMDLQKPILDQLRQLTKWSLQQIRQIYAPFRKRKGSPILSRSQFQRFIRLSRITSFFIYDKMKEVSKINVFQIVSILTLMSYSSINHKIQFLFNIFNLQGNKYLNFKQLILMFVSLMRSLCIVTGQNLPDNMQLHKYAQTLFARADLNNDQSLQLNQILNWFQSHNDGVALFHRFQPQILGRQQYHVFNQFLPYTSTQIQTIFTRINKVYLNQQLQQDDYKILTPIKKSLFSQLINKQNESPMKFTFKTQFRTKQIFTNYNHKSNTSSFHKNFINTGYKTDIRFGNKNISVHNDNSICNSNGFGNNKIRLNQLNILKVSNNNQCSKLPMLNMSKNSSFFIQKTQKQSFSMNSSNLFTKKKFHNIIITKGRTITKKQIFDLRSYFDKISNGNKTISIQNFLQSFNQQKYNHMKSVAASLYNFLDKRQTGKVNFIEFILKLHPDLTKNDIKSISKWSDQYSTSFNMDRKIKANTQNEQHKKRTLPKSCLPRYKQMYYLFDNKQKGYVSYQDLKRVLGDVSTDKELIETFEDCDKDKDGKLSIHEFAHIILPPDLEIEGLQ